jgi:signal transduction histidine kinase
LSANDLSNSASSKPIDRQASNTETTQAASLSEEPRMRLLRDPKEVQILYLEMISEAKKEILLILPSSTAYLREVDIGVIDALFAASRRQVKVQILTPGPFAGEEIQKFNEHEATSDSAAKAVPIEYKRVVEAGKPGTVTVLVIDRSSSLIIEQVDDSILDFNKAIGVSTYSARSSTVKANIRFFERFWEEENLLEKERKSRREAELLQDILAHDLRNYNQIVMSNAEMLQDGDDLTREQRLGLIDGILDAVNRSSKLVERAKRLGKIITEETNLHSINLIDSIQHSIDLVVRANNGKPVIRLDPPQTSGVFIIADELLDEVFVNILSNSVMYSEKGLPIEIKVDEEVKLTEKRGIIGENGSKKNQKFWRIQFIDQGRGIPEDIKEGVFTRYMQKSSGSGLGLSIVHALVVDRYSGMVRVRNRVDGDYRGGTIVEVWLKAVDEP